MDDDRSAAINRLKEKRALVSNVVSFLVVGAVLVIIWAASGGGYFWPVWVLGFWALGLIMHAWSVFGAKPFSEQQVEREMHRQ